MEGKRRAREAAIAFLREFSSPPWVVIQVYRRRRDDPKKWEYLALIELEDEMGLGVLESLSATELEGLIPWEWTKRRWGGGDYQFRFFWRDELGRIEQKRSRNVRIEGYPVPKR